MLPFPERRERGRRRWGYRDLQTFWGSTCGNYFVTSGYFVGAVLAVGFRAVSSQSQPVFVIVGLFFTRSTFVTYYPVYEIGLNFRLSLVWMVHFG